MGSKSLERLTHTEEIDGGLGGSHSAVCSGVWTGQWHSLKKTKTSLTTKTGSRGFLGLDQDRETHVR